MEESFSSENLPDPGMFNLVLQRVLPVSEIQDQRISFSSQLCYLFSGLAAMKGRLQKIVRYR